MDEMVADDMDLSQKERWIKSRQERVGKAIAPGVAAQASKSKGKRFGTSVPMFDNREEMHSFLQDLGMAPGGMGADILDSMLYMSEGEFQDAMISLGAAVPILGGAATIGRKTSYGIDKAKTMYGGHVQKKDRFIEGLNKRWEDATKAHRKEQAAIDKKLSMRQAERHWDKVDTKIALDKVARQTGNLTKREMGLVKKWEADEAAKVADFIKNQSPAEKAAYERMKKDVMEKIGGKMKPIPKTEMISKENLKALRKASEADKTVDEITDLLHRIDK